MPGVRIRICFCGNRNSVLSNFNQLSACCGGARAVTSCLAQSQTLTRPVGGRGLCYIMAGCRHETKPEQPSILPLIWTLLQSRLAICEWCHRSCRYPTPSFQLYYCNSYWDCSRTSRLRSLRILLCQLSIPPHSNLRCRIFHCGTTR